VRGKLSLSHLILFVALLAIMFTLISSTLAGYRVERETLIDHTLESNTVYAQKLASTTDVHVNSMIHTFREAAGHLDKLMIEDVNHKELNREADRLLNQTRSFNAVVISSAEGNILASSSVRPDLQGNIIDSPGGKGAINARSLYISDPYVGMTGRTMMLLTYPIFDHNRDYIGFVGGAIYLTEENMLTDILEEHFYEDGSAVFVLDREGKIVYSQEKELLSENNENYLVDKEELGDSSGAYVLENETEDSIVGYASVLSLGWTVVVEKPLEEALVSARKIVKEVFLFSLPLTFLSIILVYAISFLISTPLRKIAYFTETSASENENRFDDIHAWYYEAIQLKNTLASSFDLMHNRSKLYLQQSTTDALTQLVNRRGLDVIIEQWIKEKEKFSIILFDIDHFKRVNDEYGHIKGDEVLQFLSRLLQDVVHEKDVCSRYGGEEFIILLPDIDTDEAFLIAEKFRYILSTTNSPIGRPITVSSGVATFPQHAASALALIDKADESLYEAKASGRNQTIVTKAKQSG